MSAVHRPAQPLGRQKRTRSLRTSFRPSRALAKTCSAAPQVAMARAAPCTAHERHRGAVTLAPSRWKGDRRRGRGCWMVLGCTMS